MEKEVVKQAENARKTVNGLVGTFYHSLDPKKRLTIPSEWRDMMGDDAQYVYVFPDVEDDCLNFVPEFQMKAILDKLVNESPFDPEANRRRQALSKYAQMLKIDAGGRIRIGDDLLAFAEIKGGVTMIGSFINAQLWPTEKKPKPVPGSRMDVSDFRAAMKGLKF